MALREAKCSRRRRSWAGQVGLSQRATASSASRVSGLLHEGHWLGKTYSADSGGPFAGIYIYDFGDHVAALFDKHGVADANVLAADFVRVVQAGPGDGRASQRHGF